MMLLNSLFNLAHLRVRRHVNPEELLWSCAPGRGYWARGCRHRARGDGGGWRWQQSGSETRRRSSAQSIQSFQDFFVKNLVVVTRRCCTFQPRKGLTTNHKPGSKLQEHAVCTWP